MQSCHIFNEIITQSPIKYNDESKSLSVKKKIALVIAGLFIGGVNGIFGAGGGMLLVPALTLILGLEQKRAHATAIAIILPLCLVSSIAYALNQNFDMGIVLPTVIGVTIGGIIGAVLLKKLSDGVISFMFFALMLFAGLKMIF